MTQSKHVSTYLPSLDVLRFLAMLMVICAHLRISGYVQGHSFFFFLTGFIIAHISESDLKNYPSYPLKKYLARRWIRTLPVFYLVILFFNLVNIYMTHHGNPLHVGEWWWFVLMIHNYFPLIDYKIMGYVWAMGVTEQYYLLWGLVLLLFRNHIVKILYILIAISMIWGATGHYSYTHLITYIPGFCTGALFYYMHARDTRLGKYLENLPAWQNLFLYFLALAIVILVFLENQFYETGFMREILLGIGFGLITYIQCFSKNKIFNLGSLKPLRYLGQISYGVYMYHVPIILVYVHISNYFQWTLPVPISWLIIFVSSFAIASFSYTYFEKPILKLKKYFY